MDFTISTVRLGVEKYITSRQDRGLLPTRVLLSMNIKTCSTQCPDRNYDTPYVAEDFPDLLPFVDMLYAPKGQAMVKLEYGSCSSEAIDVVEGLSQGLSMSSIFAGKVLNHILRKLDRLMLEQAHGRHKQYLELGFFSDDGQGCIPILMGYMDIINAIVHIEDAAFFMYHFKRLSLPFGEVFDQDKIRVMTSTNGHKLTDLLKTSDDPHLRATGDELSHMIQKNSTKPLKMACHTRSRMAFASWGSQ